jgi:DNA polymerase-3 subunit gamma/tau
MYVSLYRRYRPQKFSDIVGQNAAVKVLQESLKEGHLGHAYLFSGPRGCGKTSAARIVAKSLNCLDPQKDHEPCGKCASCTAIAEGEHLDVIEIDGASNRGIGEIRDLKTRVNLKPLNAEYKVYIIDEVHMLTEQAFNALLKTLEEPPANVIFLLATTEPNKVPVTIRSRCQHIPFHRISIADIVSRISYICEHEKIVAEQEAIWEISRQADGALRDALSLTEQAVALGNGTLSLASVLELMGGNSRTELEKWVQLVRMGRQDAAVVLHDMLAKGISSENFAESLFAVFRDLWLYSVWGEKGMEAIEVSEAERDFIRNESINWTQQQLKAVCLFCNKILPRTRYGIKIDVFSGLLLLELTNIIENKKAEPLSQSPAVAHVKRSLEHVSNKKTDVAQVASVHNVANIENIPQKETAIMADNEGSASTIQGIEGDNLGIVHGLENSQLGRLLSKLKNKQLQIAAALLDATISKNGESWSLSFITPCPAENYLNIPQNFAILSDAVNETYGLNSNVDSSNKSMETAHKVVPHAAPPTEAGVNSTKENHELREQSSVSGAQRILKLMGAEVLYVKDASLENPETSESEDAR